MYVIVVACFNHAAAAAASAAGVQATFAGVPQPVGGRAPRRGKKRYTRTKNYTYQGTPREYCKYDPNTSYRVVTDIYFCITQSSTITGMYVWAFLLLQRVQYMMQQSRRITRV